MIDAAVLLRDLKRLIVTLEVDVRERIAATHDLDTLLTQEWQSAKDAARTSATLHDFKEESITQAAVHWLLMGVFIRFLEDNGLVERPYLTSADAARRALAQDRHESYFRTHPADSDREYLLDAYRDVGRLPGMGPLFDERHNPLFRLSISGDGAMAIVGFWQKINPDTGLLVHDFSDPEWSTRFLGDLYQDLSEAAQKKFALLQTPKFVEEFILDRTLDPAIAEFGYREVRMIDPTCGSGHFLLGGFTRLLEHWQRNEPGRNARDCVQQALNGVYGVDLNPFAVAITRFRLLIAALKASGETKLAEAPDFRFNLASGDSLLHGLRSGLRESAGMFGGDSYAGTRLEHAYVSEDLPELNRILDQRYHAVVGNPPYITVKDAALNDAYRGRYQSCHRQYSLGVPFTERFFDLAVTGSMREPAGYVGMITANSFMKREFGKKLIEEFLPRVDLTHVIDSSGADIPGHGTPTVIIFGRCRPPVSSTVRTAMGIKGEPPAVVDPAHGLVWQAIVGQIDSVGSESEYISVSDTLRATFARHPWSIGGGGAAELKEIIAHERTLLGSIVDEIGSGAVTREDDAYLVGDKVLIRKGVANDLTRPLVEGETVRDWLIRNPEVALWPYNSETLESELSIPANHFLWPYRMTLSRRVAYGTTQIERGLAWFEYSMFFKNRYRKPFVIAFAFVATHNHFVLDRGGKVFKQSTPIIILPPGANETDHLGLLGLLNSSVACFWGRQTFFPKGGFSDGKWQERLEWDSTKLQQFPIAEPRPVDLAQTLDRLAQELAASSPSKLVLRAVPSRAVLEPARIRANSLRRQMIAVQEELDWRNYQLYGLAQTELSYPSPPEINMGERAFEIVLARRVAVGLEETSWFLHHGATAITQLPDHWPTDYCLVVNARIALIETDKSIGLIERPEYKRRWVTTSWAEQEQVALKNWLLDRLERALVVGTGNTVNLTTTNKVADHIRTDTDFMQVAELYAGRSDFDVAALVSDLVAGEAVPLLPSLRYTESGLRKRTAWEHTWALQRREDAGEIVADIPVPPKYKPTDFQRTDFWRLRGGLDVPKERFNSLPHCSRGADGSLLFAWAGWTPLQVGTAIATHYLDMKDNEGWDAERLKPLLAGIAELVPWIKQWHNDPDAEHGTRMGDYLDGFVDEESRNLGLTREAVIGWQPPVTTARRGRRRAG